MFEQESWGIFYQLQSATGLGVFFGNVWLAEQAPLAGENLWAKSCSCL